MKMRKFDTADIKCFALHVFLINEGFAYLVCLKASFGFLQLLLNPVILLGPVGPEVIKNHTQLR